MRTQNPLIILLHYHSDSLKHCNMASATARHVCIKDRNEGDAVDQKTVSQASVFLVNSYLGRRAEMERLCIAGVVVWRWAGRRWRKDKSSFLISPEHLSVLREASSPAARPVTAWLLVSPAHLRRENLNVVKWSKHTYFSRLQEISKIHKWDI